MKISPINFPQLGDTYDGLAMRTLVDELERLVKDLAEQSDVEKIPGMQQAITQLQSAIGDLEEGELLALAQAVSLLQTRVEANEDTIEAHSQQLVSLSATVSGISDTVSGLSGTVSGHSDAISSLSSRVTVAEGTIEAHSQQLVSLSATVSGISDAIDDLDIEGIAEAISELEVRVESTEDGLDVLSQSVLSLSSTVSGLGDDVSGHAQAISLLTTRVGDAEDDISAVAQSVQSLSTTVGGLTSSVTTISQSVDGVRAKYGVRLDVNGHVTGFVQNNDGTQGDFIVVADKFAVVSPSNPNISAAPFEVVSGVVRIKEAVIQNLSIGKLGDGDLNAVMNVGTGRIVWNNGSFMKVAGVGFGTSNQFIEWFGPTLANVNQCSEANAIYYLKVNGDAYFGGSLSAGVLHNSIQTSNTAQDASVILGPFGTNGNSKQVTAGVSIQAQDEWNDPSGNFTPVNPPTCTFVVERRINQTGSWQQMASRTVTGSTTYQASPAPLEAGFYLAQIAGSTTFTDTNSTVGDFEYRIRLTARNITIRQGAQASFSQRLAITSVEG